MQTKTYNFKVGDKIQVVNPASYTLKLGSIHTAYDIFIEDGYTYVALSEEKMKEKEGWDVSRFVKYEEKEKQVKVEMGKKYRVVNTHRPVRVICTDRKYPVAPCIGLSTDPDGHEVILFFDNSGYLRGQQIIEEVPEVDWSKVEVDTPIWVKFSLGSCHKRHFNHFDGKLVHYWTDGRTSFTCLETCYANAVTSEDCSLEEPK